MLNRVKRKCGFCLAEFLVELKEINRGYGKFCSRKCGARNRFANRTHNTVCAFCETTFYRKPSNKTTSKSGLHFCNRSCKDAAQRINGIAEIQPSHYGTGYRAKAWANLEHQCCRCEYKEFIEILEVHHIDFDHGNNSLINLEIICPNCHDLVHRGLIPQHK